MLLLKVVRGRKSVDRGVKLGRQWATTEEAEEEEDEWRNDYVDVYVIRWAEIHAKQRKRLIFVVVVLVVAAGVKTRHCDEA